jgi:hypothetical protein
MRFDEPERLNRFKRGLSERHLDPDQAGRESRAMMKVGNIYKNTIK